jgi:hypothetical protein
MSRNDSNPVVIIVVFAIILIGSLGQTAAYWASSEDRTVTIKRRYTKKIGDGDQMRVEAAGEVYVCKDVLSFFHFSSADVYSQLEEGHTYKVKVAGWRFGLFSMFENIYEVEADITPKAEKEVVKRD